MFDAGRQVDRDLLCEDREAERSAAFDLIEALDRKSVV